MAALFDGRPAVSARSLKLRATGFSLIELMVSLAIGLIVTLAITGVLVRSEGSKRSSTSVNDVNQTGAYVSFVMDRALRSAGSGFSQRWNESFGCPINAAKSGSVILPAPSALAAPFDTVSQSFRLAPVIITRGPAGGSDVVTVMAGTAGYGEAPIRILTGSVTTNQIGLPNTLTFSGNDLVMLIEDGVGCMVQQVTSGFVGTPTTLPNTAPANQLLPLSGAYASTTGTNANITQYGLSGKAYAVALGNVANTSQFQIYGVGPNNTLMSYDILQLQETAPVPIADGVVEMRALYGIDSDLNGTLDSWVAPTTGTDPVADPYSAAVLSSGAANVRQRLRTIVSVKVGFILRTSLLERAKVNPDDYEAPATISLFSDLGASLTQTRSIAAGDDRRYRYRTVEVTVPLRNVLMLPGL